LAGVHERLGLLSELSALSTRGAQKIAGRDLRNTEMLDQPLRLSPLARTRRAEQDQPTRTP
jgi:hypothetical protein